MNINGVDLTNFQVIIFAGRAGVGKSYWARKASKNLHATYLSSDEIREKITGYTRHDAVGDEPVQDASKLAYEEMYKQAIAFLRQGKQVILDATHVKKERKELIDKLKEVVPQESIIMVLISASERVIANRMRTSTEMENEEETRYEAWKRVNGYFTKHFSEGTYSMPTVAELGIKIIQLVNE